MSAAKSVRMKASANGLSAASVVFGIIALVTSFTVVCLPLFGGLSLTFALLSRGDRKMSTSAKVGIVLSVLGLVVCIAVYTVLFTALTRSAADIMSRLPFAIG